MFGAVLPSFLIGLAVVAADVRAEPPDSSSPELSKAIEFIDALIAEKRRTSAIYRIQGRLSVIDFGAPPIDWRLTEKFPANPDSRYFNSLVFHAVCREDERALRALFSFYEAVDVWHFSALEAAYLQAVVTRRELELDFRAVARQNGSASPNDLRTINRMRDLDAALEARRYAAALQTISSFARLCKRNQPN